MIAGPNNFAVVVHLHHGDTLVGRMAADHGVSVGQALGSTGVFEDTANIVVGDLMVEIDEKTTRGHWKKVIITQIFPSKDSRVRTVEIRDGENRTYVRPITCLIPLKV